MHGIRETEITPTNPPPRSVTRTHVVRKETETLARSRGRSDPEFSQPRRPHLSSPARNGSGPEQQGRLADLASPGVVVPLNRATGG